MRKKCGQKGGSQVVVSPTFVELFQSKLGEPVPGALEQPRSVGGNCEVSGVGSTACPGISPDPWAATVR